MRNEVKYSIVLIVPLGGPWSITGKKGDAEFLKEITKRKDSIRQVVCAFQGAINPKLEEFIDNEIEQWVGEFINTFSVDFIKSEKEVREYMRNIGVDDASIVIVTIQ